VDIDTLIMTAASKYQIYATGATTIALPFGDARVTAVTFPDQEQAETFAAACMGDGIPAGRCGPVEGEPAVLVIH
jgi:hypothetical protein